VLLVDEEVTRELLIIPGLIEVDVNVALDASADIDDGFEDLTDESPGRFALELTPIGHLTAERVELETIAGLLKILFTQSLLPREPFMEIIEGALEHGLWHRLNAIRPYDELADIHEAKMYEELSSTSFDPVGSDTSRSVGARDLVEADRWVSRRYNYREAVRAIDASYVNLRRPVRFTVRRLSGNETFQRVISELRAEGWKDWHLLTAVANIVVNDRARRKGVIMTTTLTAADRNRFLAIMSADESMADPIPPVGLFTVDNMRFHIGAAGASSLPRFGLELHTAKTDPENLLLVLGARFNYWSDDVMHDAVFE
jgi:hypothetical protein